MFFPLLFTTKSTFKGPIIFFPTKCSLFLLKQLLSEEHSKELLEAAICLSTLIWNNIMTADRWSEHGLSFHHGTSEVFLNKFDTSKLMLDTGKRGKREDFIEFDKSQSATTGLLSCSTSQTAAPEGCSHVCNVQRLPEVVQGRHRWTTDRVMASQGALMYVGRAGWPDHLIQQTRYCSSSFSKDSNAGSEREYTLDAEYQQWLHNDPTWTTEQWSNVAWSNAFLFLIIMWTMMLAVLLERTGRRGWSMKG